jgi:hypothetical protein
MARLPIRKIFQRFRRKNLFHPYLLPGKFLNASCLLHKSIFLEPISCYIIAASKIERLRD